MVKRLSSAPAVAVISIAAVFAPVAVPRASAAIADAPVPDAAGLVPDATLPGATVPSAPLRGGTFRGAPFHGAPSPSDTVTTPLTLAAAVRLALANHPSLVVADAALAGAEAGVLEASAARLPVLATDGSLMRFAEPMVTAPLHGFNPASPPAFDRTLLQGGVSLSYTLFDGGGRGSRLARAEALTAASEAGVAEARTALLADVIRVYLRVQTMAEVVESNARRLVALEEERGRAAQLLERGKAARVQVLRAEAALGSARAEWHAARGELEVARGDLARLTGLDASLEVAARGATTAAIVGVAAADTTSPEKSGAEVTESGMIELLPVRFVGRRAHDVGGDTGRGAPGQPGFDRSVFDRAALLDRALAASPEIRRLRRLVDAAEAARGEARALWFPSLQAVGRYAEYASGLGREQGEWQGGLQFSFPLFTGGARRAAGARALAESRSARARLELARLAIARALDGALAAVEAEEARVAALETAAEQAEEVARIERLALSAGAGTQTDYLVAEAELLRVRAARSAARAAEIAARVELARVLGELSVEWVERNLGQ